MGRDEDVEESRALIHVFHVVRKPSEPPGQSKVSGNLAAPDVIVQLKILLLQQEEDKGQAFQDRNEVAPRAISQVMNHEVLQDEECSHFVLQHKQKHARYVMQALVVVDVLLLKLLKVLPLFFFFLTTELLISLSLLLFRSPLLFHSKSSSDADVQEPLQRGSLVNVLEQAPLDVASHDVRVPVAASSLLPLPQLPVELRRLFLSRACSTQEHWPALSSQSRARESSNDSDLSQR
eukprot:CAMPEP_0197484492 /NCGR_PEP_ID=MMETSP1309-20131121/57433_1 /TAXON_ID=464262 /ORGANISM="Genus nov. species nov., Strain RCC998" /LENGTH=234 /DNA_ID=CAMNT_0043027133 /DNA_START=1675 /DNA_END=2376 /DNA_ORIENTATION=+